MIMWKMFLENENYDSGNMIMNINEVINYYN